MVEHPSGRSESLPSDERGPVAHQLEDALPIQGMGWQRFERLVSTVLAEVVGAFSVRDYGKRGQDQRGLDVVGHLPEGGIIAVQAKEYQSFTATDLRRAVDRFVESDRPFTVTRFVVAASADARDTAYFDQVLAGAPSRVHPATFELWDQPALSQMLRDQPKIVAEFWGLEYARAFCLPFEELTLGVPHVDSAAVAQAVRLGPEVETGAADLVDEAARTEDPQAALALLERATGLLRDRGFSAHAGSLEPLKVPHLVATGRVAEAARQVVDEVWTACALGRTSTAQVLRRRLPSWLPDTFRAHDQIPRTPETEMLGRVTEQILGLFTSPVGEPADPTGWEEFPDIDRARLIVSSGERAVAVQDTAWLQAHASQVQWAAHWFSEAIGLPERQTWGVRADVLLAEACGDWGSVLGQARRSRLRYELAGLVLARHARWVAMRHDFEGADEDYEQATQVACLDRRWQAAATWVRARRALRIRWQPFQDDLRDLGLSLTDMGPSAAIIPRHDEALSRARQEWINQSPRTAAIHGHRALVDAVVAGDWDTEMQACSFLGQVLTDSEPQIAAGYYARAGDAHGMRRIAQAHPQRFIDPGPALQSPSYWTVAAAYELVAAQADLVPDDQVHDLLDRALTDIHHAAEGDLVDGRANISRYLTAVKVLAGLATRTTPDQARRALEYFQSLPTPAPGTSYAHAPDEAHALAGIADAHPHLRDQAFTRLATQLVHQQTTRTAPVMALVDAHADEFMPHLHPWTDETDDLWVQEVLALHDPTTTPAALRNEAMARLLEPLPDTATTFTYGTPAIRDAVLAAGCPTSQIDRALNSLMDKADSPMSPATNREQYLTAITHLAPHATPATRTTLFPRAVAAATTATESIPDELDRQHTHPLGFIRGPAPDDTRPSAAMAAAALAITPEHQEHVRALCRALLGEPLTPHAETHIHHALTTINDTLVDDIQFLSHRSAPLRVLAARLWAQHHTPPHTGYQLAHDPNPHVRHELATHLYTKPPHPDPTTSDITAQIHRILDHDPCYSVRHGLNPQPR